MMNTSPVLAPKASNPKILPSINFFGERCGGGSGLVADKKEMNFLTLFQTQCAH